MNTETHHQRANDIWSICKLLRGFYLRSEHRQALMTTAVTGKIGRQGLA